MMEFFRREMDSKPTCSVPSFSAAHNHQPLRQCQRVLLLFLSLACLGSCKGIKDKVSGGIDKWKDQIFQNYLTPKNLFFPTAGNGPPNAKFPAGQKTRSKMAKAAKMAKSASQWRNQPIWPKWANRPNGWAKRAKIGKIVQSGPNCLKWPNGIKWPHRPNLLNRPNCPNRLKSV